MCLQRKRPFNKNFMCASHWLGSALQCRFYYAALDQRHTKRARENLANDERISQVNLSTSHFTQCKSRSKDKLNDFLYASLHRTSTHATIRSASTKTLLLIRSLVRTTNKRMNETIAPYTYLMVSKWVLYRYECQWH